MATRFWVVQPVSGAVVSVTSPPQIRLTVASTTGMTTGDVRTVFGVGGTTEANGTWTITVIDGTHIDLQGTTFANVYTSGGSVNGRWDGTNTNNWVSTSGGTNYGQTIPGAADSATFDGSSGGGTVTVNSTISLVTLTCGAFTGTLDFSANNNNVNLSGTTNAFNGSGTAVRTINLGDGTWTLSGAASGQNLWNMGTTTNLTFAANNSTIVLTGAASGGVIFAGGGLTYNNITLNNTGRGGVSITGTNTIALLTVAGPNFIMFPAGTTVVTAFSISASSSNPVGFSAAAPLSTAITLSSPSTPAFDWMSFRGITFGGAGAFSATNSEDNGLNSNVTITGPSGSGSGMTPVLRGPL